MSKNTNSSGKLSAEKCSAAPQALNQEQIRTLLSQLDGWTQQNSTIGKTFEFKNYYQTISFVNAIAWVANREDHHPELGVGYNKCKVEFSTHSVNGLSENDFICAAKIDALFTI